MEPILQSQSVYSTGTSIRNNHKDLKQVKLYREGFKNWKMSRRRPEFESGEAVSEAAKPGGFSDAGGPQRLWLSDADRTNFRITSGI